MDLAEVEGRYQHLSREIELRGYQFRAFPSASQGLSKAEIPCELAERARCL